jgi:hypothetical protein
MSDMKAARRARLVQMMDQRGRGPDGEEEVRDVFRAAGAISPASARVGKDLPPFDADTFDRLLHRGVLREGAPGSFYLYENRRPRSASGLLRTLLFWILVVLIPVALMKWSASR